MTSKAIDRALNKWSKIQIEAHKMGMRPWKYVEYYGITDEIIVKWANDMKAKAHAQR